MYKLLLIITLIPMLFLTSCAANFSLGQKPEVDNTEIVKSLEKDIAEKEMQILHLTGWVQSTQNVLSQIAMPQNIVKAFQSIGYRELQVQPTIEKVEPAVPQEEEPKQE